MASPVLGQALAEVALRFLDASKRDLSIRLETWTDPSRSTMAPFGFSWDFFMWRLIIATPSTRARPFLGRSSSTLPDLPLWAPAMTTTSSPRLIWNFFILEDLRRERDDLHEVLRAQ